MKDLERVLSSSFSSQTSLLWAYGGHPFSPSSVEIYEKQQQLMELCHSIWPRKTSLQELGIIESALYADPELRHCAMEGVGMSEIIMSKLKEDGIDVLKQLEEMFQNLSRKYQFERDRMENNTRTSKQALSFTGLSGCCAMNTDMLCQSSGLSCWLDTLPINDYTSFGLDMSLLQGLSSIIILDETKLKSGLSQQHWLLESTLTFSLDFSSRPPTDFSPHQKISWVLDAWDTVKSSHAIISSSVLEMWFNWHTSLWKYHSNFGKQNLNQHSYSALVPHMLFQPVATQSLAKILQQTIGVKDLNAYNLKLGVASRNLWLSSPHVAKCHRSLMTSARSLFQHMILSHEHSFEDGNFSSLRSKLSSAQQEDVSVITLILASSSHHVLKSLITPFVEPLLNELYAPNYLDPLLCLGRAWLRIGGLRYHLLCCDDVDPAVKKNLEYFQLTERIASLELEIEVRQECVHLAGCFSLSEYDKEIMSLLCKLKNDRNRLQREIVFRSDSGRFKKLTSECDEFRKLVTVPIGLVQNLENLNMQRVADQVHNWQETATRFVDRLSNEYSEYVDIVQPIQLAIYEMKLGLSLVLSSCLHKQFLDSIGQNNIDVMCQAKAFSQKKNNIDVVLGAIYSFTRFPRGFTAIDTSDVEDSLCGKLANFDKAFPTYTREDDVNIVKALVTSARDHNTDELGSVLQLEAAIHQNLLLRVVHYVAQARCLDNVSFKLMKGIFDEFANLWMKMKIQVRIKEEHDSQQYRFRPRDLNIKNVIEIDVSMLKSSLAFEAFSEWQELSSEEVSAEVKNAEEEHKMLEEDWNLLLESILNDMVKVYNTMFGSTDLVQPAGIAQASDSDVLRSFLESYALGTRVIKELDGILCSSLDAKLIPEHVLFISLEHERNFVSSHRPKCAYNFYKDSNASQLAKMVDPVMNLKQKIQKLPPEWVDHSTLQKIVDVTDMILSIPMSTPLAKALSGLQFLLNRVRVLQETVAKFPLSDQLDPIIALVSSWQKMEYESWPALLDDVQAQFDINAGQLWFPLYSVLLSSNSDHTESYSQSTMQSLEEFIQTSSIGEFRKRLQLVFAFHGHISTAISQNPTSRHGHENKLKILYNTFGFYIQFLPIILEQLASNRKSIEAELNELLKLCRWERNEWYMTMESSKRTREKFKKLLQKYNDVLKQPVMLILDQKAARSEIKAISAHCPSLFSDTFEKYKKILEVACHETQFRNEKRSMWPSTWRNNLDIALEDMRLAMANNPYSHGVSLVNAEGNVDTVSRFIDFQSVSGIAKEELNQVWHTFEKISTNLIACGELWKDEKKSVGKRRALSEILKLLDGCGLSKHRSMQMEDEPMTNKSSQWSLQRSFVMEHLLLKEGRLSSGDHDVAALEKVQNLPMDNVEADWKTANEYFFKSISSLSHLRQVCLNFHKDFTLEQVNRSISYLDHLVDIQKSQREAAYGLFEDLECLKKRILPLKNLFLSSHPSSGLQGSVCSLSVNQDIVSKTLWRQKKLFDTICNTLNDECLLLKSVENQHLNNCQSVGASAKHIRNFLEEFVSDFKASKGLLDNYLFGDCGSLTTAPPILYPYGITKQMEQDVKSNFYLLARFKNQLDDFRKQDVHAGLGSNILLDHFEDLFKRGNLLKEYYESASDERRLSGNIQDSNDILEVETMFSKSLMKTCKHIVEGFDGVSSVDNRLDPLQDYLGNINSWQELFASRVKTLQMHTIHQELAQTLDISGKLLNLYGNDERKLCFVESQLKHLYSLLDVMITFGNCLLNDFMVAHRTLSMVTHVLEEIFASLYSQGYGCSTENEEDDNGHDGSRDAKGTGMGEGAGVKDVSEQIEDEDQLLGIEKSGEEQDVSNDVPSKNDKGIEMEQDFDADAFSVSEDSDEGSDDENEEPRLDSAMGETGDDSKVVDEKLPDNKDDDNDENPNKNEKYETGPSVKDNDLSGRELRAKEDDATVTDEAEVLDSDESNKQNDENVDPIPDEKNDIEDMNIDKDEAFSEPTGLKPDEPAVDADEDIDMNQQDVDGDEDDGTETVDGSGEGNDGKEEEIDGMEENSKETEPKTLTENSEMDSDENNHEQKTEADTEAPMKDVPAPRTPEINIELQSNVESATEAKGESNGASMRDVAQEATWSNSDDMHSDLAPIQGLPDASQNALSVADSSKGGKLNDEHISQLPELDPSALQKSEPNPFRNIGDAIDGWKERAKVSVDLNEKNDMAMDELEDEGVDEYGFTSGLDKGTAQALGPAAADQIDKNIDGKEPNDGDGGAVEKKESSDMDIDEEHREAQPIKSHPLNIGNTVHEKMDVEESVIADETHEIYGFHEGDEQRQTESSVHMNKSYMTEDISHFGSLSVDGDDNLGIAHNLEDVPAELRDSASALWRRYELKTTRLSQELTEQLRLVMEPTLASKLQGDYKTGKRISMKKVIPYIASHYRKDKIWLRRTRPNKRNYQVVIAIDDSSSMSENECGDVAMEALVTVCRAMSQLEIGSLAVASFGKKGNIQLLHDFDQPFTGEAGAKMLSSLTFKQENTIADEPVVDLLKYLNNMLDAAVMKASGQNPLEQLVLIISDGRLHEKEKLKRCVRDVLSKKRMVAVLLLDNQKQHNPIPDMLDKPTGSILELLEVSFEGGKCGLVKYMDSFPFPYYVILRDIKTLPRTLADLLRQWFELMQLSRA